MEFPSSTPFEDLSNQVLRHDVTPNRKACCLVDASPQGKVLAESLDQSLVEHATLSHAASKAGSDVAEDNPIHADSDEVSGFDASNN